MPTSRCSIHHKEEEIPEDVVIVCFECGHVYATRVEVVEMYNVDFHRDITLEEWEDVPFCPLCLHDW